MRRNGEPNRKESQKATYAKRVDGKNFNTHWDEIWCASIEVSFSSYTQNAPLGRFWSHGFMYNLLNRGGST